MKKQRSLRMIFAGIIMAGAFLTGSGALHAATYDLFVHGLSTQDHCPPIRPNTTSYYTQDVNNYWEGTAKPGPYTRFIGFNKNASRGAFSWDQCGAQSMLLIGLEVFCRNGNSCRIYTHSTGGLVAADMMAYLQTAGLGNRYNIIHIRLMANASGGAELATDAPRVHTAAVAFKILNPLWAWAIDKYVLPWTTNTEVMRSVRINPARQEFNHNMTAGRRLYITMGHNQWGYYGFTQPFLRGRNDSTLSNHTLCGVRNVASLTYCTGGNANVADYHHPNTTYRKWDNYYAINMAINANHYHGQSKTEWQN